jgi:hypothetical protein
MAKLIKDLRVLYPNLSIAEVLDLARERMMTERIQEVEDLDIGSFLVRLKQWDLTESEVMTLLEKTPFSPTDLLIYLLREKPKHPRRSWLSCLGSNSA